MKTKMSITKQAHGLMWAAVVCIAGLFLVFGGGGEAKEGKDGKDGKKHTEHYKAYQIYQKRCLGCHDSVADPEKPGRTRDEWHIVVNVMHGYGLKLTTTETEAITDLLYDLRSGIEKDAG